MKPVPVLILAAAFNMLPGSNIAQHSASFLPLTTSHTAFVNGYELSSIVIKDGTAYLPAEKCGLIFRYDLSAKKIIDPPVDLRKLLGKDSDNIAFEGAALYGDHILMTDEQLGRVYDYSLAANELKQVVIEESIAVRMATFVGESGIEGIAINRKDGIAYIVRERNGNNESLLLAFQINLDSETGAISLKYLDECTIRHPRTNPDTKQKYVPDLFRYCDLFYDADIGKLLCLKSYYDGKGGQPDQYVIDILDAELKNGKFKQHYLESEGLEWQNISAYVVGMAKKTANNVEGFTKWNDRYYLISDNAGTFNCKGNVAGQKPALFFRVEF